jgi:NTE family protein
MSKHHKKFDRHILLLQGGGSLGAYQVGVFKGMAEHGFTPDWVVGTSIGAINSAIIAGNLPKNRVKKLVSFWQEIATRLPRVPDVMNDLLLRKYYNFLSANITVMCGQPDFFTPRLINPWLGTETSLDKLSYYVTHPLHDTLVKHVDFNIINDQVMRLSMGSVHVSTGNLVYFDNNKIKIGPEHVMASGALPPGFPAVEINKQMYWDGGLHSNTQINLLFETHEAITTLCFMVQLFNSYGCRPRTMDEVYKRAKDIGYSSHHRNFVQAYRQEYNLRNAIYQLSKKLNKKDKKDPEVQKLIHLGHPGIIHLARLHYKGQDYQLSSKDFDFSAQSLQEHLKTGYDDVCLLLRDPPWEKKAQKNQGLYLYELSEELMEDDTPIT